MAPGARLRPPRNRRFSAFNHQADRAAGGARAACSAIGLVVERGKSSISGRPEAGSWGHREPPSCSGCALGCVGAAWALGATREADGAVSSNRADGTICQLIVLERVVEVDVAAVGEQRSHLAWRSDARSREMPFEAI